MDTKTLAVGQRVWVESGVYGHTGRVSEVGPGGVSVETEFGLHWFDNDGKSADETPQEGPYYVYDTPPTERPMKRNQNKALESELNRAKRAPEKSIK